MTPIIPHISCYAPPSELAQALTEYSEVYTNGDGCILKHVKLTNGRFVRLPVKEAPVTLEVEKPEINFLPAGKISYSLFEQLVELFRKVSDKLKGDYEAHAWILWSEETGYYISVPEQTVSKASVKFDYSQEALPTGHIICVDIHSHNTMGAFFSGTDDNNDKMGIYYSCVIGKLTSDNCEYVLRFNLYGDNIECELSDVFETPTTPHIEVPEEWLKNISMTTSSYKRPNKSSYSGWFSKDKEAGQNHEKKFQEVSSAEVASTTMTMASGTGLTADNTLTEQDLDAQFSISMLTESISDEDWNFYTTYGYFKEDAHKHQGSAEVMEPDPVGISPSRLYEQNVQIYGVTAADAYDAISMDLDDIAKHDDLLLAVIRDAYEMLGPEGRNNVATNGL